MQLPETFLDSMRELLGAEYDAYLESFAKKSVQGIRINTGKIAVEDFLKIAPFPLRRIPWVENGFYVEDSREVTKHPYYYAGLYYVQEPSAMLPASRLPIEPGDRVLDLCAAPGGKATELGSRLRGSGLLVANDISNSRAKGLLKNLELFGIGNLLVTSEAPEKLLSYYRGYFDKILIDAPCSGEGMFRKDPFIQKAYRERGPAYYAEIQKEILETAAGLLKKNGAMLFSTCTFSALENEGSIAYFLQNHPEFRLQPMEGCAEFCGQDVIRIYPHRVEGEGHFAALLVRGGEKEYEKALLKEIAVERNLEQSAAEGKDGIAWKSAAEGKESADRKSAAGMKESVDGRSAAWKRDSNVQERTGMKTAPKAWSEFAGNYLTRKFDDGTFIQRDEKLYFLPKDVQVMQKIRYLRTGLFLGSIKKDRFEPGQALAMYLKESQCRQSISFAADDERVRRYLKGETVSLSTSEAAGKKGWCLVCVDGYPLGWAKYAGDTLKNKYYAGWRMGS